MPFKVQVGPPQIAIHHDQTILLSEENGQMAFPSDKGLYFRDTRLISAWEIYTNGTPWMLLNGGAIAYYAARIFLTNHEFLTRQGKVPARTLSLAISRSIDGGMHEDLDIVNYGREPVSFGLELSVRCDFADTFEVKSGEIVRRGKIDTLWEQRKQTLSNTYSNKDFERSVTIRNRHTKALYANGRLSFDIELDPGQAWHTCLHYDLTDCGQTFPAPKECVAHDAEGRHADMLRDWNERVLSISTSNEEYYRFFRQAIEDMASLRLQRNRADHMIFIHAAVRPRQPDRVAAERYDLSGIRSGHAGYIGRPSGDRARRLPRRRAGQD